MARKSGFTLIELLVVISIIALLLSILMPALTKVKAQARAVVCKSNLKQLAVAHALSDEVNPKGEIPDEVVRQQLYQQYTDKFPKRKAIWKGKETDGFRTWLDEQRAEFDPNYTEYKQDTGKLALKNEKETPEFKQWFKENKLKNDESGQEVQTD